MKRLLDWANVQRAPYGLAIFRILFGLIMLWDLKRYSDIGLIESYYPRGIIFPYEFLNLPLMEQSSMKMLLVALMISGVFITIGLFYRFAMLFFALGFSYLFFLDQTLYNNHLYLVCLLSFLLVFMPADAAFSIQKQRKRVTIPQWTYRLLQFQIGVVFFFGGVSKLNPYWLDMHPVQELLAIRAEASGAPFFNSTAMQYFIGYGGLVFDLVIAALLWIPKTRKLGMIGAIFFSLSNAFLFRDIFIFPFLLIASLLLFMDQEKLKQRLLKWKAIKPVSEEMKVSKLLKIPGAAIVLGYMIFQLALPLRHYFIEGYTDWTGEGQRFAWRMKIQHRDIVVNEFAVFDLENKVIHPVKLGLYLYPEEITMMAHSPQMVLQFANYLKERSREKHRIKDCWVKAKLKIGFNGLEPLYMFHPDVDLCSESKKHESFNDWMLPLSDAGKQIVRDSTTIVW